MAFNNEISFKAGGTIAPCRFVKADSTAGQVVQASANSDKIIGVSQEWMKRPPGLPGSDAAVAAESTDMVKVAGLGNEAMLTLGSGGATYGDYLTSDGSGQGITATTGQEYGAQALQTGSSGDKIRVQVIRGTL